MHFIPGGWSTLTISRERLGVELLVRGMGREMCELAWSSWVQFAVLSLCCVAMTFVGQRKVIEGRNINCEMQVPTCQLSHLPEGQAIPKSVPVGADMGTWSVPSMKSHASVLRGLKTSFLSHSALDLVSCSRLRVCNPVFAPCSRSSSDSSGLPASCKAPAVVALSCCRDSCSVGEGLGWWWGRKGAPCVPYTVQGSHLRGECQMSECSHAVAEFLWLGSAATQSHLLLLQKPEAVTSSTCLAELWSSTRKCCGKLEPQDPGHSVCPKELPLLR